MLKFKATNKQIAMICMNAINHSKPVGMGVIHYLDRDFKLEDIRKLLEETAGSLHHINFDYVEGRMVKLTIHRPDSDGYWLIHDDYLPSMEYQSWADEYPTYRSLIESALGAVVVEQC